VITCLITGKPFPREFRTCAISKIFIIHVRIALLRRGNIARVGRKLVQRADLCSLRLTWRVDECETLPTMMVSSPLRRSSLMSRRNGRSVGPGARVSQMILAAS